MQQEAQTHNAQQLVHQLQQERQVRLSPRQLRQILKKGYRWKRTRQSHRSLQDPLEKQLKQADLNVLQQTAWERYLKLKYLDESGFDCWSPVRYS